MAVPAPYRQAIARYGPLINALARQRYGISGQQLLGRLTQGESHFDMGAVSRAGARGATQFMPATRAAYIKRYGIDPWASPDQAEHATAIYLRGARGDLQAYNPGDSGYTQYILGQRVGGLGGKPGSQAASGGGGGGGGATASTTTSQNAGPQGNTLALLKALEQQSQPASSAGLPLPSFAAHPALPATYQAPASSSPVSKPDISGLLAAIQTSPDTGGTSETTTVSAAGGGGQPAAPAGTGGPGARGGYAYPLARRGKIIGTPYTGTHTLGNWQSDNAVDIATPIGTPVRSIQPGKVVKVVHHPQDGGRFAGDQITIQGPGGGTFYTHLSKSDVRPGQRIKRGQVIGRSGSANGVAHLHIGRERGNPLHEFG